MLKKWSDHHGEPAVADAWKGSYATEGKEAPLTRIEINSSNQLLGGWPNDSLIAESGNGTDKGLRSHRKKGAVVFVRQTERHLRKQSFVCLDFFGKMKPDVHSAKFFHTVESIVRDAQSRRPCFLNLKMSFTTTRDDLYMPAGSFVTPSRRAILSEFGGRMLSLVAAKQFFSDVVQTGSEWFRDYCQIVNDPESHLSDKLSYMTEAELFDHLHDTVSKRFHCIRPIVPRDIFIMQAIDALYHTLINNKYKLMPLDDIFALGTKGFVSCTCTLYLKRGWCHHSCAFAVARGIITHYPSTMNPRVAFGTARGRPRNIPRGEMLMEEPDQTAII
jgi:hypothetical protein